MKPSKASYERRYYDDSGVEFGVSFDSGGVTLRSRGGDTLDIPLDELDWFIEAMMSAREIIREPKP